MIQGEFGYHFISCKKCQAPISNYMINEQDVVYVTVNQIPNNNVRSDTEGAL